MTFVQLVTELAQRFGSDPGQPDVKATLQRKVNQAYKEVSRAFEWEHLKRSADLNTVANDTVGTVTITKGSRTVTGSGTAWTNSYPGRYFQPTGSANWYKIVSISGQVITLQNPIIEATQTGIGYTIWKRYYYLFSDVRKIIEFGNWITDGRIEARSMDYIKDETNNQSLIATPWSFIPYGVDTFASENTYTTGQSKLTNNSNVVTGSGTKWMTDSGFGDYVAGPGDIFNINSQDYRIKRVESDTQIILLNNALQDIAFAGYTIKKDLPIGVQYYPTPDKQYIFPYTYIKRTYDMVNDNETPELPEDFDMAILDGAEYARLREVNASNWQTKFQEYVARVKELKARISPVTRRRISQFKVMIPSRTGRGVRSYLDGFYK